MSVQTRVIDTLRNAGLKAMLPGQHDGKCREAYFVVTDAGRRAISKNNALRVVLVTAFVPMDTPLALDNALTAAREALLCLKSVSVGGSSEADIEEGSDAIYASIELTALCAA